MQINVRTEEECMCVWEGQMMDTRCVKILRQDERVGGVILSFWTKTLSNMRITAECESGGHDDIIKNRINVQFHLKS